MGRLVTGPQHYRRRFLSPVVAGSASSWQRNRMPAIEVEADCRRRRPAPPHL